MTKKNTFSIILILLLLFSLLLSAGLFGYQWQQAKSDLEKQIGQNENLIKQINELQKEIEELKISKEEKTTDETDNWKIYKNEQQGFEIKFPLTGEWDYDIRIDERTDLAFFDGFFKTQEEKSDLKFIIRKNLFSEVTPLFLPQYPFCNKEQEMQMWNNKISQTIYSSYDPKAETDEEKCDPSLDKFLLDEHSIDTQLCIGRDAEVYNAELRKNGEYFFYCTGKEEFFYYFSLNCKKEIWAGKEGRDKCSELFNQILSTFRFIK